MKVDTILLPISEITINPDVNIRELDPNHIADLADAQKDYGETEWQKHWKELPKINDENIPVFWVSYRHRGTTQFR